MLPPFIPENGTGCRGDFDLSGEVAGQGARPERRRRAGCAVMTIYRSQRTWFLAGEADFDLDGLSLPGALP